jgi:U3 small nucleolar RNA-associated protein 22
MGPLSPKRRKLDHQSDDSDIANRENASDEDGTATQSSSEEESLSNQGPTSKQPHTRPKHVQNTDESALYAGGMYKSSMFKLQVDEMLAEVRPNSEKQMGWVEAALHKLNTVIGAIEERDALPVSVMDSAC